VNEWMECWDERRAGDTRSSSSLAFFFRGLDVPKHLDGRYYITCKVVRAYIYVCKKHVTAGVLLEAHFYRIIKLRDETRRGGAEHVDVVR
jgi:hypothetical protein